MALPFLNGNQKKRDQVVAIDLGGRTSKAVHLQRRGESYTLSGFVLQDAPLYEKTLPVELLAEHLKMLAEGLGARTKSISVALGVNESVVRHSELPQMPVGDMRMILKNNSKNYLQQEMPGHVFDCYVLPNRINGKTGEKGKLPGATPKSRVIAAGAREQLIRDIQSAAKHTGLTVDLISPGLIGPVNAFELAMPEVFAKETVALIDIGFKHTTISIVERGELMLTRVLGIGGDRISTGLAESLGISYAEAEGIKVGMPNEVQPNLEALVGPLGRELRASIDFYEHQYDNQVNQILLCGGTSRSELIMQILQSELMAECKLWNPCGFLQLTLPPQQTAEIEQVSSHLAVAVGTGIATF